MQHFNAKRRKILYVAIRNVGLEKLESAMNLGNIRPVENMYVLALTISITTDPMSLGTERIT